uniref:hypothetical protein n=1 Tax=Herbidospora sakaeratensis TaxID=564415 RepID=UPI0007815C4B|nr:hypothetical protein [Herbidospora sakaeratensis]
MATFDIRRWRPEDFSAGAASRRQCTWGGDGVTPCPGPPAYTVIDRAGRKWAACSRHVLSHIDDRLRDDE